MSPIRSLCDYGLQGQVALCLTNIIVHQPSSLKGSLKTKEKTQALIY